MDLENELQGSAEPLGTDVPVLGWPGRMQPHAWQPWEIPNVSLQLFSQNTCETKDKFVWCHLLGLSFREKFRTEISLSSSQAEGDSAH